MFMKQHDSFANLTNFLFHFSLNRPETTSIVIVFGTFKDYTPIWGDSNTPRTHVGE